MSLDNTLLKIRREYTGDEKYRLFLKHLDNIEAELREERKKTTQLLVENAAMKREKGALVDQVNQLKAELGEYKTTEPNKKFIRMSCYIKLAGQKAEWEQRFWGLHAELQQLKTSKTTDHGTEP